MVKFVFKNEDVNSEFYITYYATKFDISYICNKITE